ncbi:type VI secretion system Vgr family protein [Motiliproteus sp. MSK22-1]|uniref:type VI secretion system Vgr family protein n=1 Tax=Motiliproteus sp. MSK22-1 TaxID=1897630 RepID=UPI0009758EC1|nr:type VI secretion system tip protein VgrG [Motiliproteus sp. MSK22-1]OMH25758.1 hypothetical protein BGP75_24840 [Motiliproteus sp. MSK22-1]
MSITQSDRIISIESPLGADVLVFRRMTGHESLGKLFEYNLEMLSEDSNIRYTDILGQNLTVILEAEDGGIRYFNGFVSQFDYTGTSDRYAVYKATIKPWLWFLTRTADCRIFQDQDVTAIVQAVLRDNGFSDFELAVSRTCVTRKYCVQYRETDFSFISRLLEEEGIYYYFRHQAGKHILVLTDDISSHESSGTILYYPPEQDRRDEQHVDYWQTHTKVKSGKYVATDFDFIKPKKSLESRSSSPGSYDHSDDEIFDYPGKYYEKGPGDSLTRIRLEEIQAVAEQGDGRGNTSKITTGKLFELSNYPRIDQNIEYLVTETELEICSDDYISQSASSSHSPVPSEANTVAETSIDDPVKDVYRCQFKALKQTIPFRSESVTRKTRVEGPQTAIVVGPAGEEIYTDEHGRVKVQFHWDRYGTSDENSSCWIRVSQNWAGKQWGAVFLPRIGQEVIVDFLEGDPDRPIITGRVYNGDNPTPYGLPANKTQSGIKSRSSKGGSGDNFNELRFEDKKGVEEIYFHAEKDFNRVVENNDTLKVGFSKKEPGDQTIDINNDRTETVGHNETISIGNDRTETVANNETINIGVNRDETVGGNETVGIGINQTITVGANKTETIVAASTETIGAAKALTIGAAYQVSVGAAKNESVGLSSSEQVGLSKHIIAGKRFELVVGSSSLILNADGTILLKGTQIKMEGSKHVEVLSELVDIN